MSKPFHATTNRSSAALLLTGVILGLAAVLPAAANDDSAAELKAAAPMIEQMQRHLSTAAEAVEAGDARAVRQAFDKADRVFALTRDFLRATEAAQDGRATRGRGQPLNLPPYRAPADRHRLWPDAFGDDEGFAGRFFGGRDPFAMLRDMQERMGRLLDETDGFFSARQDDPGRMRLPRMDMTENQEAYIVRLDMPGLEKSDIQVKVEGLLLTITGRSSSETASDDDKPLRRERRSGMFQRAITLPGPVEADQVDARYENGVLTITVPKAASLPVDPRSIPIR